MAIVIVNEDVPNVVVVRDDVARGADGSQIFTGSTAPSSLLGKNTDVYVNTANGNFYKKLAGSWVLQGNIRGPAGPSGSGNVQYFTLNGSQISAKAVTLGSAPGTPNFTRVDIIGGITQEYGADFTVSGNQLSWSGLGMEPILAAGDKLVVSYN